MAWKWNSNAYVHCARCSLSVFLFVSNGSSFERSEGTEEWAKWISMDAERTATWLFNYIIESKLEISINCVWFISYSGEQSRKKSSRVLAVLGAELQCTLKMERDACVSTDTFDCHVENWNPKAEIAITFNGIEADEGFNHQESGVAFDVAYCCKLISCGR